MCILRTCAVVGKRAKTGRVYGDFGAFAQSIANFVVHEQNRVIAKVRLTAQRRRLVSTTIGVLGVVSHVRTTRNQNALRELVENHFEVITFLSHLGPLRENHLAIAENTGDHTEGNA